MPNRLIVLSNRIPTDGPPSGGLVVALHELLAERGGLWIGSSGTFAETPGEELQPVPTVDGYDKATFDLTAQEHEDFYLGYANSVLWPLCHHRTDLLALDRRYAAAYDTVNARVARMLAKVIGPDDLVWVHDYHFLPIAYELRRLNVTARIGLFLHIPFPTSPDLMALPEQKEFFHWLAAFDLVGLQTEADVARCLSGFREQREGELLLNGRVKFGPRVFQVRSFPIGIDGAAFRDLAERDAPLDPLHLGKNTRLAIGVDRLDYSKGLPQRIKGFARWLETRKPGTDRATLLQITPPSREAVEAYQEITTELETLTGRTNGQFGEIDWTPVRLIENGVPREVLAPLYRRADLALVTPLADGMNLVAKEFVAAQDAEDPGVLILSNAAGAAEQMVDALIVNAHDADEISEAIERALTMPLTERKARHAALMKVVEDTDIATWGASYIDCLRTSGEGGGTSSRLQDLLSALKRGEQLQPAPVDLTPKTEEQAE
ncbi:alpha,alpha-trehalose-phosphate synthase (UDP-forming) [Thalassorhabdomicrobium marinisediminis]|uniref:Trehalose-6-phosphate synthase n=1 Tax=Thalassorhabdomicrobium marinisediminis TaxID=2170577 RepID=A0A2T7G1R6_9RHOB|nr:trehalose-6-phosphate synthase [Thalassorhabdomicrobium marinisediminis]PVA08338.1 trehalose-6-phosphate synthase [Thalassorhabdomicrobium marinisediminis]